MLDNYTVEILSNIKHNGMSSTKMKGIHNSPCFFLFRLHVDYLFLFIYLFTIHLFTITYLMTLSFANKTNRHFQGWSDSSKLQKNVRQTVVWSDWVNLQLRLAGYAVSALTLYDATSLSFIKRRHIIHVSSCYLQTEIFTTTTFHAIYGVTKFKYR